jgi:hypothetical protein
MQMSTPANVKVTTPSTLKRVSPLKPLLMEQRSPVSEGYLRYVRCQLYELRRACGCKRSKQSGSLNRLSLFLSCSLFSPVVTGGCERCAPRHTRGTACVGFGLLPLGLLGVSNAITPLLTGGHGCCHSSMFITASICGKRCGFETPSSSSEAR